MFVNKIKIRRDSITGDTFQLPITITQNHDIIGQSDIINSEFVSVEKQKSINSIIDYEEIRFLPANIDNILMNSISYQLHFNQGSNFPLNSWNSIGFTQEDLLYRRKRFKKSFLELVFYDSPNLMSQSPIFKVTLFPQLNPSEQPNVNNPIRFKRENPITNPNGFAEGFYLYFYKDLVSLGNDYDLYMRASFSNALTGVKKPLMLSSSILPYDDTFSSKIHLKYTFRKDNNSYLYVVDDTNSLVGYNLSDKIITINLYESVVL